MNRSVANVTQSPFWFFERMSVDQAPVTGSKVKVVKRTVRILEHHPNGISIARAVSECFREASTEYVDPVDDVSLAGVVVSDEYHRFVTTWRSGTRSILVVQQEKLVVQDPFTMCGAACCATTHCSLDAPLACQMI